MYLPEIHSMQGKIVCNSSFNYNLKKSNIYSTILFYNDIRNITKESYADSVESK